MRQLNGVFITCLFVFFSLYGSNVNSGKNPESHTDSFSQFMDIAWGTDAAGFKKRIGYRYRQYKNSFYIPKFKYNGVKLSELDFVFENRGNDPTMKLSKKTFTHFRLDSVIMHFKPNQFGDLLSNFVEKYGKPFKTIDGGTDKSVKNPKQKIVIWVAKDKKRMVYLRKYTKNVKRGIAYFCRYNSRLIQ